MMKIKNLENPKDFLSTRQSARHLQVSLGTVQKMVETGELLAWKTQGGHRRILMSSLEQLLKRRRLGIRERCGAQFLLLAVFRRQESFEEFKSLSAPWKSEVDLHLCSDTLEALMQSVSLAPDVIYLDFAISPVEQVHLLHYLSKNTHTKHIPVLVESNFLKLHPQVLKMASDDFSDNKTRTGRKPSHNPMIRPYQKEVLLLENGEVNQRFSEKLENLILDCMAKKCERT
ncbi:excisionase family DNA-binding protein [Polynucleobacter sp. 30F-ANTBAC]|jgi:excisionase family DNA binding protein|uniref:helix-turn-helix domain-containing protein n=1 Tax=Polynucleobacter sp. 30F-ANTBAC TaxID=2689095 RepID=UPI001C0E39C9|nr:helix-turn-helix domain-containing protein [Polynucleobacter sp. 30F-ANTBAC]MBU3600692.1 excisionase family DNA-binding protein [Polynucleobacter sp. 30F-ANTBAC]